MPEVKRKTETSETKSNPAKTRAEQNASSSNQTSGTTITARSDEQKSTSPAARDSEQAIQDSAQAKTKVEARIDELTKSLLLADGELSIKETEIESNVGSANQQFPLSTRLRRRLTTPRKNWTMLLAR